MTEQQIKKLPGLIEDGNSLREIAKKFGCHRNTVGYWVKKLKLQGLVLQVKKGRPFKKINETLSTATA